MHKYDIDKIFLGLHTGPIYVRGGVFGEGVGPIFGTEFECSGSEAKLTDCSYSSNVKGCTHNDDAGVICNEKSG